MEMESETLNLYGGGEWNTNPTKSSLLKLFRPWWMGFLLASNYLDVNPSPLDIFVILDVISTNFSFV
jgi:hypothetical protein